jgi:hypothetical protein
MSVKCVLVQAEMKTFMRQPGAMQCRNTMSLSQILPTAQITLRGCWLSVSTTRSPGFCWCPALCIKNRCFRNFWMHAHPGRSLWCRGRGTAIGLQKALAEGTPKFARMAERRLLFRCGASEQLLPMRGSVWCQVIAAQRHIVSGNSGTKAHRVR